jgi:hypothetical protein
MEYRTKSGAILTDEMLEEMGLACERGEYPGTPIGDVIVGPARQFVTDDMISRWCAALDSGEWPEGEYGVGDIVKGSPPSGIK